MVIELNIGEKLKEIRIEKKMTQMEFAETGGTNSEDICFNNIASVLAGKFKKYVEHAE